MINWRFLVAHLDSNQEFLKMEASGKALKDLEQSNKILFDSSNYGNHSMVPDKCTSDVVQEFW